MAPSESSDTDTENTRAESPRAAAGAEPKLVFRTGPSRGTVFVLTGKRLSLGRDPRNDIVIKNDIVSARHVIIGRDLGDDPSDDYWIQDGGSKNGTFLNGRSVKDIVALREGDVIALAQTGPEIQFTYREPSLPSALSTSTAVFARTHSLELAFRELLPRLSRRSDEVVSASGVRELIDFRLEMMRRNSRRVAFAGFWAFAALCILAGLWLHTTGREHDGPQAGGMISSSPPGALASLGDARARVELDVEPIYAGIFHSYRDNSIGQVQLVNEGKDALTGARLVFELYLERRGRTENLLVEDFVRDVPEVPPGESWEVAVTPVLSNNVLFDTDHEVTAEARLSRRGEALATRTRVVMVYGRHVVNWKNPEQIAAFVDSEDPVVRAFVNAAWESRPEVSRGEFPPENTVSAVTLLTALAELRLRYLRDAQTPSTFSGDSTVNDRVKYPGETLREGTGDCDDLSVLCCSLLEAVGVPTAFVVGTEHVLFMFDSGLDTGALEVGVSSPFDSGSVVSWEGRVWIPVEATSIARQNASFATAWADAWRRQESIARGEMKVVDIEKAWKKYRPLRPQAEGDADELPGRREWPARLREKVSRALEGLREQYLESLNGKVEQLSEELEGLERDQAVGLLYARSGLYGKAKGVLERAIFADGAAPRAEAAPRTRAEALSWPGELSDAKAVLLGDLAVTITLSARSPGDFALAAGLYELALQNIPDGYPEKAEMMLRLALVYRLSGELAAVKIWASKAFTLDPALQAVYEALIRGDGSVAGDNALVLRHLRGSLRRP